MRWRRVLLALGAAAVAALLLAGCENMLGGDDDSGPSAAPGVATVSVTIDDRTNEPGTSTGPCPDATAFIIYVIYLENPSRNGDITGMTITDPLGNPWVYDEQEVQNAWNGDIGAIVTRPTCNSDSPHSRPLGNYEITLSADGLDDSTFTKSIYKNDDPSQNSDTVRTAAHADTGSGTGSGSEILGLPTGVSGTLNGNDAEITFTVTDENVGEAYIWFFADGDYLGRSFYLSQQAPLESDENTYTIDISNASTIPTDFMAVLLNEANAPVRYRSRSALTPFSN